MPNIIPSRLRGRATASLSLDDLRENPGRLHGRRQLAELNLVSSHDGVRRLIDSGWLPQPYRIGGHDLWEGRDILRMIEGSQKLREADDEANVGEAIRLSVPVTEVAEAASYGSGSVTEHYGSDPDGEPSPAELGSAGAE